MNMLMQPVKGQSNLYRISPMEEFIVVASGLFVHMTKSILWQHCLGSVTYGVIYKFTCMSRVKRPPGIRGEIRVLVYTWYDYLNNPWNSS